MLSDELQGELQLKVLQERIPEKATKNLKQASKQKLPGLTFFRGCHTIDGPCACVYT